MIKINTACYFLLSLLLFTAGCGSTSVSSKPAELGIQSTYQKLTESITQSSEVVLKKHIMADWRVPLSGLLNLEHPKALDAGLKDKSEAIQIYAYTLTHPIYGTYLIDSGMSESLVDAKNSPDIGWIVKQFMDIDALKVRKTTKSLLAEYDEIKGVFLTHIHLDHIMGLNDLHNVQVYVGPGDAQFKAFSHIVSHSTTDRLLSTTDHLLEWQFNEEGIIDIFGDGSVWAIRSPGHTPGSTVYLANTTDGPQLMLGDVTHTRWGWENGVEPGTFSYDIAESKISLARMLDLATAFPQLIVHPGHQSL